MSDGFQLMIKAVMWQTDKKSTNSFFPFFFRFIQWDNRIFYLSTYYWFTPPPPPQPHWQRPGLCNGKSTCVCMYIYMCVWSYNFNSLESVLCHIPFMYKKAPTLYEIRNLKQLIALCAPWPTEGMQHLVYHTWYEILSFKPDLYKYYWKLFREKRYCHCSNSLLVFHYSCPVWLHKFLWLDILLWRRFHCTVGYDVTGSTSTKTMS